MLKKIRYLLPLLTLLLIGAKKPLDPVEFTIINKAGRDIAISLKGKDRVCANKCDTWKGEIYYLTVPTGNKDGPSSKTFEIEMNTYGMQLYYLQTWDPVYGLKCPIPAPNTLMAHRNIRLTVLPCDQIPMGRTLGKAIGEPTMWKYLPFPIAKLLPFLNPYWKFRMIY
jgi:hypothetical protein